MRNLQKILALVLALVMSLSLMASAGARDFTDGDQIDETFAESVDVLTGLEVFQGYPSGDFQPKGDITRAEVAAIIYRIATGDVTDSQVGIYADYNKFSDVPSDNWAAGYINYCANAEYIKGRGDGKFYPQDKVTGYEALAMILRVVGYDKNGEFTGADWQVQTAATANQRKVTKNVNAGTLGNPASRETVAELLCQAILINTVNYTLAFGYQISTDPEDTIAYQTFKMEKLEGVVTGNEVADLKESSPLTAGQTRLVIDGREEIVDIPTTLDKIGKSVRAYIRPQGGTTRKQLVTADVYDTELNHVYDSFAPVSSVGNSTGSEQGINSIKDAEHFINYDFVNRWTATIRITYVMDVQWTEYEAMTMRRDNGGHLWLYNAAGNYPSAAEIEKKDSGDWKTLLTSDADYTYHYTKTIPLDEMLTNQDYSNLYSIFTNADRTDPDNRWLVGEVYVGTASFNAQEDISDEIRWTDFTNTYLKSEQNRQQVEKNGRGNRLIIIDNDDDGIAEYVLQTIYTIAKVSSDAKNVDIINTKLYDTSNSDTVNSTVPSNTLVSVSGKELAKSEDTLAAGDVVIYALIDGNIRAQKAETKTEKVDTVNRAAKTITVVGEDAATYNESAVHTHSNGLKSSVNNMAGNTNYTMYFDLDGNLAAFTEGANGGLVLITNGWYNSTITGSEYAIQAYVDGALQTVNVGTSGSLFVGRSNNGDNRWNNLRTDFGSGVINNQGSNVHTIVANLDGNTVTPVDKAYLYSQNLRMLDMKDNEIPDQNNWAKSKGTPYETVYGNTTLTPTLSNAAYNTAGDSGVTPILPNATEYEVRGLSNTVYYVVYNAHGTDPMTTGKNVVVRTYTGYGSVPSLNKDDIEDVYAVGARSGGVNTNGNFTYYTAQVVVIEMKSSYNKSASEQVFIPDFSEVGNSVGIEYVTMIRGNGNKEQVKVDLGNSDYFNGYDPASSANNAIRRPGLYFMDPSDTNSDVYVLERMTPADIRANDYLVGYVSESSDIMANNYPQVEKMVRPMVLGTTYSIGDDGAVKYSWVQDFGNGNAGIQRAKDTYPIVPTVADVKYYGRAVRDTTKTYTYGGTTATLVEAPAYNVLAQTRHNVDTTNESVNGLNERWDKLDRHPDGNYWFPNNNRNEVLVRYDGNTIVWAVSFDETSNLNAQRVWWNCLPVDEVDTTLGTSAPTLVLPNGDRVTATASNTPVSVPYSDWSKWTAADKYVVEPGARNSISVDNGVMNTQNKEVNVDTSAAQNIVVVTRGDKDGASTQVYTFVITYTAGGIGTDLTNYTNPGDLALPDSPIWMKDFIEKYHPVDDKATAEYDFFTNNQDHVYCYWINGKVYEDEAGTKPVSDAFLTGTDTNTIAKVTIIVKSEDKTKTVSYESATRGSVVDYKGKWNEMTQKLGFIVGTDDVGPVSLVNFQPFDYTTGQFDGTHPVRAVVEEYFSKLDRDNSEATYTAGMKALIAAAKDAMNTAVIQKLGGPRGDTYENTADPAKGHVACSIWCGRIHELYHQFLTALNPTSEGGTGDLYFDPASSTVDLAEQVVGNMENFWNVYVATGSTIGSPVTAIMNHVDGYNGHNPGCGTADQSSDLTTWGETHKRLNG